MFTANFKNAKFKVLNRKINMSLQISNTAKVEYETNKTHIQQSNIKTSIRIEST